MGLTEDAFKAILSRLESAIGKTITDVQKRRLCEVLTPLDARQASMIASGIERMENIPKNIVAVVINAIDRNKEGENHKVLNATTWKAQELCTNSLEFGLFFGIMGLTMKIHQEGIVKYNHDQDLEFMDIDQWISSGRPKTWSPVIDHFLSGYEKVYKSEKLCVEYLQKYHGMLKDKLHQRGINDLEK